MKKFIPLSLIAITSLYSSEVTLEPISVETTMLTEVSKNAQVSADLSQALSASVPSIDMNRRSGISNDIYIRGQKRDNISVEVDGTKTCGACPNRMDPPVSHVLASQIEDVEVIEGPYDVESFGTMSGGIKITTKAPSKKGHLAVDMGYGSFGYTKIGASASGGNDTVRILVSATSESSDQYKDGDGNTMSEQVSNYAAGTSVKGTQYQDSYKDLKAYSKKSVMAKAYVTTADNQELRLSATANRSDDILYPSSPMDANYDDSNIYSVEYNINALSDSYENLNIQYYKSDVDHPMGNDYRLSSTGTNPTTNTPNPVMTNWLTTDMQGLKIKNSFNIVGHELLVGLDASERKWDGHYEMNHMMNKGNSIDDAVTKNMAIFAKLKKSFGDLDVVFGARVDSTDITNGGTAQDNDYTGVNANLVTTYNIDKNNKVFLGFGQASRAPDARELYFTKSMKLVGTPTLEQTTNQELDLGYELKSAMFDLKIKVFYSNLSDYIYLQKGVATNAFQNIDATVYGAEIASSVYATNEVTVDMGISYKVGEKSEALAGQTDTDLADIAPLRANIITNWEYMSDSIASLELQASDKWSDVDSDNGEQEIDSWAVLNLKVKHAVSKNFDFTLGVNNILDETYAVNNTYADITLLTAGGSDVMMLNEPGRYVYTNLNFKF